MRPERWLHAAVLVTGLTVIGFAALFVFADVASYDAYAYRVDHGLPLREHDRWSLTSAGYVVGGVLSLVVIVLLERWWNSGRLRTALTLALVAAMGVGVLLLLDGLLFLSPSGDLADAIPSGYAVLSTVQGLVMLVVPGLVLVAMPRVAPGARKRVRLGAVVLKVRDADRAARFWSAALGYVGHGDQRSGASPMLVRPDGDGPQLTLDTDDATHLDLFVPDEAAERAEITRLLTLGARRVDWPDVPHVVLADPEGNLFCVVVAAQNG
jgi:catechol 2,3-dioxygenase-like lactoylglutathione lyase family enzyme